MRKDATLRLSDHVEEPSTLAAKGYEQKLIRQTPPERGNWAPVFEWAAKRSKIAVRLRLRRGKNSPAT